MWVKNRVKREGTFCRQSWLFKNRPTLYFWTWWVLHPDTGPGVSGASGAKVLNQLWVIVYDDLNKKNIFLVTNIELFTCASGETRCWSSYSIITNELIRGCSSTNLTETGCVTDNQNGMICRKSKIRRIQRNIRIWARTAHFLWLHNHLS